MGPVGVVVLQVFSHDCLQVPPVQDEDPVQALPAKCAHPALGVGVRLWRPDGSADDPDAFGSEDLVEGVSELGIPVPDQEPPGREGAAHCDDEVSSLLGDPGPRWVRRHAGKMHLPRVRPR